jgi:protoporphyrinogen oxidase
MPSRAHTLIAGGGLAGLACARELGADFTLVEAEDRLGGLCRTDVVDGFSFDWTGHWFHARDPEVRRLVLERWLAGNLLEVQRRAIVYSEQAWTQFPYQFNLHGLPPQTIADCLLGFLGRDAARPLANADDFILAHLGEGFARHFMRPYNQKLFTVPCTELSPEWGGRFIPRPSLEEVVRGAVGLSKGDAGYNASFWYPAQGGIESLVRGLERDVLGRGEVRLSARIEALDLGGRRARLCGGEEIAYDRLVWTAPLSALAKLLVDAPAEVMDAAARLRSVSVTVVEIGARDLPAGQRFHWAYFPEPKFGFYRIGSPSEVNRALAPPGCRSFAVEFAHRGPVDKELFIENALAGLQSCGLLDRAQVLVARARTIPVAYVLFDHAHAAARAQVLAHLEAAGVQVAGRYGRWEYSSMEDALLTGREAARRLA